MLASLPILLLLAAAAHPAEDLSDQPTTQPGEIRRGIRADEPPEVRQRRFFERLARQVEPELRGSPHGLDTYVRHFAREVIHDERIVVFNVSARFDAGTVVLTGYAEFPEHVNALVSLLNTLGFDKLSNAVIMVPVLKRPFAIVRSPRAFIRSRSSEPSEVLNEAMSGEKLYLLAAEADRFLCHAADGYVGWIDATDVEQIDELEFRVERAPQDSQRIAGVIDSAKTKLGLPYVWGGRSDDGVDCSGLVQTAFASQGVHLPRDAEQQASVGKLVATRWHRDNLRSGDLLFFLGRRGNIAHVAIYLGDDRFIEASGKVKISSFDPNDENYEKRRDEGFCFARRVLD